MLTVKHLMNDFYSLFDVLLFSFFSSNFLSLFLVQVIGEGVYTNIHLVPRVFESLSLST